MLATAAAAPNDTIVIFDALGIHAHHTISAAIAVGQNLIQAAATRIASVTRAGVAVITDAEVIWSAVAVQASRRAAQPAAAGGSIGLKLVLATCKAVAAIEVARILIITVQGLAGQAGSGLTGLVSVTDVVV